MLQEAKFMAYGSIILQMIHYELRTIVVHLKQG